MTLEEIVQRQPGILVVDDLPSARKVVTRLMQKLGFTKIFESSDGTSALETLRKESIGLVISDWEMPSMSGLDFLRRVRSDPALEKIPFVIVTSHSERDDVVTALKFGASEYVLKPFSMETLQLKLSSVFERTQSGDGSS